MFPRHYSEERLIEYLDGEMPWWRALAAARHLRRCWECRALCDGLREETRALVEAYRRSEPLEGNRVAAARARFHEWESLESSAAGSRQAPPLRVWRRAPALAGFGALAVFAAAGLWIETRPPAPVPSPAPPAVKPAPKVTVGTPPAPPGLAPGPAPIPSPVPPPAPTVEAPLPLDWVGAALRAEFLLHELGLCTENSVQMNVEQDTLRLSGVVNSRAQVQRLRERVLEALPDVEVALEVRAIEDIAAQVAASPAGEAAPRRPEPKPADPPVERLIRAKLRERGVTGREAAEQTNAVLTQAVRLSEQAWSEAWAVRRLAARFPAPGLAAMTARQRNLVAAMARDHLERLHAAVAGERGTLAPYLDFPDAPQPLDDALLPASVDRIQGLVGALCSMAEPPAKPVEVMARELTSLLASADAALAGGGGLLSRDWESLAALYQPARPR